MPQGNTVFAGTIADNLRMVRPVATDAELIAALETACAYDFVRQLPDGIYARTGELGHGLSEGQAQRIAVARAVLRGAPNAELKKIASFYDYIEVMPIANNRFLVENGTVRDDEGLRDLNRRVARLAAELEKPLVATGDVHFLDPKDEIYRRILQAAKKFSDADRENPLYYLSLIHI